ncbi:MAG: RdgB/HAM1 family non-canonical purine NTP pyrophosphatase [Chthoniobacterales bacterium]|nr:RdgB/HAM1 family non-canonical purine NTP pyrophosphatase [Chthoniobacterales bacterium]
MASCAKRALNLSPPQQSQHPEPLSSKVRVVLATRNPKKLLELQQLIGPRWLVLGIDSLPPFPEPIENGKTFQENARIKALETSLHSPWLTLADDSGLEVDALNGAPGVRSARFAGENATDAENLELLLRKLEGVPEPARTARFQCALAVALRNNILAEFHGTVEGSIITNPRGVGGFGYDPFFVPIGSSLTFAEMNPDEKHKLSHRGKAMQKFRAWLETQGTQLAQAQNSQES